MHAKCAAGVGSDNGEDEKNGRTFHNKELMGREDSLETFYWVA